MQMDTPKCYTFINGASGSAPGLGDNLVLGRRTKAGPRLSGEFGNVLGGVATASRGRGVSGARPRSHTRAQCASGPRGGDAGQLGSTSRGASEWATAYFRVRPRGVGRLRRGPGGRRRSVGGRRSAPRCGGSGRLVGGRPRSLGGRRWASRGHPGLPRLGRGSLGLRVSAWTESGFSGPGSPRWGLRDPHPSGFCPAVAEGCEPLEPACST